MTSHKKILISAYAFYPEYGGLEQQIFLLSREFIKAGHEVTVLTEKPAKTSKSHEVIHGITVIRMSFARKRLLVDYIKLVVQISIYIIQHRSTYDVIYLRAAITLYPLIFSFWKAVGVLKSRLIVTADTGGDNDEIIQLARWPLARILLKIITSISFFISACESNTKHYIQLNIPREKIVKIYNGIDTSNFSQSDYPSNIKNFLFIGRFIREKGLFELVEAMGKVHKNFPESKLFMAGDGPIQAKISSIIKHENLERSIVYMGKISEQQRSAFFDLGECIVAPSYSEAGPLVVFEAAARKKIIISTDVGDLKNLFNSQILFCEKRSASSLEFVMKKALTTDFHTSLDYSAIIPQVEIKKVAQQYLDISKSV